MLVCFIRAGYSSSAATWVRGVVLQGMVVAVGRTDRWVLTMLLLMLHQRRHGWL